MSEESIIAESYSSLKDAILLARTDIVRGILSTAAESRLENGFFEDEELDEEDGEDFRIKKWDEDYEDNPYDLLRVLLNYVDDDAGTALHLATKLGYVDITRALLSAGSDPTRQNKHGLMPFEYCTDDKMLKIYNEQLLEAAAHNQIVKLQKLLAAGVSVNATDGTDVNNTALHWAASFGGQDTTKVLCENGANPNITNSKGLTPLFDAVARGDVEITKVLLSYGAKTDVIIPEGPHKNKKILDFARDGSQIKQLLLSPPEIIIPEKVPSETDGDTDSNNTTFSSSSSSKVSIVAESKTDDQALKEGDTLDSNFDLNLLWPYPQHLTLIKGSHYFPEACLNIRIITFPGQDAHCVHDMWRLVEESFKKIGFSLRTQYVSEPSDEDPCSCPPPGVISCCMCPLLFTKPESYSLHVSSKQICICGSEPRALWYGINTLLQLFKIAKVGGIPQMQIHDWPDLRHRGVLLDLSHGRNLNGETLTFLVDILSSLKYNQLIVGLPTSFGCTRHSSACNKPPYTQSDIYKLERFCKKRFIELIPYLDQTTEMASCSVPSCTTEHKATQVNLKSVNSQMCSSFTSSRFFHVGMDIVDEVATDVLQEKKDEKSKSLLEHLKNAVENCDRRGKMAMFWANGFHEQIKTGKCFLRAIAMEYGRKPGHNFGLFSKHCLDSGVPYYVCPATLSWASLVGTIHDSVDLIDDAVQCAVNYNAMGVLITDWSAYDNVTPVEASIPAFVAGAALSWNSKIKQELVLSSLAKVLDLHVFQDDACLIGSIFECLSSVHRILNPDPNMMEDFGHVLPDDKPENAYRILQLFLFPDLSDPTNFNNDNVQKTSRCLRRCQDLLAKVELKCRHATAIVRIMTFVTDIALYSCRVARAFALLKIGEKSEKNSDAVSLISTTTRTDLANRILSMIDSCKHISESKRNDSHNLQELLQTIFQKLVPPATDMIDV